MMGEQWKDHPDDFHDARALPGLEGHQPLTLDSNPYFRNTCPKVQQVVISLGLPWGLLASSDKACSLPPKGSGFLNPCKNDHNSQAGASNKGLSYT